MGWSGRAVSLSLSMMRKTVRPRISLPARSMPSGRSRRPSPVFRRRSPGKVGGAGPRAQWALKHAVQFGRLMPGLAAPGLPMTLGGTSNHFQRSRQEAAGRSETETFVFSFLPPARRRAAKV